MVVLSFSVFKDELLAGKKTRTMRRATSKKWQSVYENITKKRIVLQVYWKQRTKEQAFLFYAIPTKIEKRRLGELSDEEWKKDGFKDRFEGLGWFSLTYNLMNDKENPALNNFEVFIIHFKRISCNLDQFSER